MFLHKLLRLVGLDFFDTIKNKPLEVPDIEQQSGALRVSQISVFAEESSRHSLHIDGRWGTNEGALRMHMT